MAKLKDIENYTPQEKSHMEEVLGHFNGNMDAYNKWWETQNDSSINNWKKALDRFKKLQAEKDVPKTIGKPKKKSAAKSDSCKVSTSKIKKAQDFSGLSPRKREQAKKDPVTASKNKPRIRTIAGEKKLQGDTNSYITLGNDRTGGILAGYQGTGATHAAAIDITVGAMGSKAREADHTGQPVVADKDFVADAARIYISQKTDIDHAFGLEAGGVGNWTARSGIGIKADHVRIIGREGIKLVTKTDLSNSQGGDIKSTYGIDIIAGNDDTDLQPMVRGQNLIFAFAALIREIERLAGIIDYMLQQQNNLNKQVQRHTHDVPMPGAMLKALPNAPVMLQGLWTMISHLSTTEVDLAKLRANLQFFKINFLNEPAGGTQAGENYICSRWNKVN